jgi:histidine triad (HIT) family protein
MGFPFSRERQANGDNMDNCIFCKIATKQIPASTVYEDDELLAFKDINPAAPVHLLIIPKQHVASLSDCAEGHTELLGKMLALAPKLAAEHGIALKTGPDGEQSGGFKTLINTGPDGGQEVYHLHLHVYGGERPWRGMRT